MTDKGFFWMVTASKGDHWIEARARTQTEAWRLALEQAQALK